MGGTRAARWDPWAALASRPHLEVHFDPVAALLGGAFYARRGDRAVIVIDPRLSSARQGSALAHELVHDERGGGCDVPGAPDSWDAVVARDEAAVNREVARRLVPADELAALADSDEELTVWAVAEAFDVDPGTAATALGLLAETRAAAATGARRPTRQGGPSPTPRPTPPAPSP